MRRIYIGLLNILMKNCANCGSENPEEASICQTCQSRSFSNSRRKAVEGALKRIKLAWVAGVISALMTLVVSLLPLLRVSIAGFDLSGIFLNIFGAFVVGALAFGIYRKSRICAAVLFGYFFFWKVVFVLKYGFIFSGLWTGFIFLYCFVQGIRGTFEWHSLEKEQLNRSLQPTAAAPGS
jgi:ribosomal protein L40E